MAVASYYFREMGMLWMHLESVLGTFALNIRTP